MAYIEHASRLHATAGDSWADLHDEVTDTLSAHPRDAVLFSLNTLHDTQRAWDTAHSLKMTDADVWLHLVKKYEKIDRLAVLPPLEALTRNELENVGAGHYRTAGSPPQTDSAAGREDRACRRRRRVDRRTPTSSSQPLTHAGGVR